MLGTVADYSDLQYCSIQIPRKPETAKLKSGGLKKLGSGFQVAPQGSTVEKKRPEALEQGLGHVLIVKLGLYEESCCKLFRPCHATVCLESLFASLCVRPG